MSKSPTRKADCRHAVLAVYFKNIKKYLVGWRKTKNTTAVNLMPYTIDFYALCVFK